MPGPASFRPSAHGCRFANAQTERTPIVLGPVPVARITGGLCGGMVLEALRTWERGMPRPGTDRHSMARVFAAQLRSFQIPSAPLRYLLLQQPWAGARRLRTTERGRREIAAAVAVGRPTPVALVCALAMSPLALTRHHVVLAYDVIADDADRTTLAIYDPNHPDADDVRLTLSPAGHRHSRGRTMHAAFALRAR
ncbi:hypothetical protein [Cumulibacter manganitolerans]|uniref:hypothetical protein n=1 Tax=Cumulibacter manganitolerans TaxID=1884992 RepID=UPI00129490AF|nr:hypothetical protein [Cumulibacter manganitolerans]